MQKYIYIFYGMGFYIHLLINMSLAISKHQVFPWFIASGINVVTTGILPSVNRKCLPFLNANLKITLEMMVHTSNFLYIYLLISL